MSVNQELKPITTERRGNLYIGGCDLVELANKYGTPLYVIDEVSLREICREYIDAFKNYPNIKMMYASKALSTLATSKIIYDEGFGFDVVSAGEIYTLYKADVDMSKVLFNGNNKTRKELELAIDLKVARFSVDNFYEAELLNTIALEKGVNVDILLRITPGIECHTHEYIQTGQIDSKFGFDLSQLDEIINLVKNECKMLNLRGIHAHIGSQIFEKQSFVIAVEKCMDFAAKMQAELGFTPTKLNLGGGYGIWYTDEDRKISADEYAEYVEALLVAVKEKAKEKSLPLPFVLIEPGRSMVGEAGVTLYTVGAIKDIVGVKKYIAVDGGMFDNPRYALYQSKYSAVLANRAAEENTEIVTVAGKCCESGDLIAVNVPLPQAKTGDILAVLSTGAYNYSMAMNYNRNKIPPCVLVNKGKGEYIVKPQTYEDIARNDVLPTRLKSE